MIKVYINYCISQSIYQLEALDMALNGKCWQHFFVSHLLHFGMAILTPYGSGAYQIFLVLYWRKR